MAVKTETEIQLSEITKMSEVWLGLSGAGCRLKLSLLLSVRLFI